MEVTRTIHPVGQGAFYSEHFKLKDGKVYNVVYDCGTKDDWHETLETKVEIYIGNVNDEDGIDALFISHFDEDHVNGIIDLANECHIKKVILPVFRKEKWLSIVEYGIIYYYNYQRILYLLREKGIKLVFVNPNGENDRELDNFYSLDRLPNRINSGTKICIWLDGMQWLYIPIYFDALLRIKDKLKTEIERIPLLDRHLKVENLKDPQMLDQHILHKVNDAYTRVVGDNNRPSMPCYSGPADDNYNVSMFINQFVPHFKLSASDKHKSYYQIEKKQGVFKAACLYTGDTTLKMNQCREIRKYMDDRFINQIDTLQVPHHGSKYNITVSSVEKYLEMNFYDLLCFTSFGYGNTYKHPSTSCVKSITDALGIFIGVNECPNSALKELFEF